ncbi:MAG: dephospho-CoA kinase [Bacteroidales bacterium]|jgi:dephospho-CoA kinase|nr:dephospho-CoA kinase [Bacteroidales bacterium]
MIKIGITGGIGSGKSVVCDLFRLHDIPVFDADREAKHLNDTSPVIREQITSHFGESLYIDDKLNRKEFARLIFHDQKKLTIANAIIHPVLAGYFQEWCLQRVAQPYLIIDAAILIEAGFQRFVDTVLIVTCPADIRLERVMKRDHSTRNEVETRMRNQLPEEEKVKQGDFVICNDNRQSLIRQVDDFLQTLSHDGRFQ